MFKDVAWEDRIQSAKAAAATGADLHTLLETLEVCKILDPLTQYQRADVIATAIKFMLAPGMSEEQA